MSKYITSALAGQPLEDRSLTGKVRPWRQHKQEARTLATVYEMLADQDPANAARWLDKSRRVMDCAPWAEFELHEDQGSGEYMTLHKASFCRVRLCPMCQWRRSLKLAAQARAIVAESDREAGAALGIDATPEQMRKAHPRFLLLTLTVKNVPGDQLARTIDLLHGSFSKLTRRKIWTPVRGWLRATEVTYNEKADTYHPHMHILLMVLPSYFGGKGGYVSQKRWRAAWQDVLGINYDPQVDVRAIKDLDGQPLKDLPSDLYQKAMGKAIAEVAKYAAKPTDYLDPSDLEKSARVLRVLDLILHKRRMVAWGGELKEIAARLQLDDLESGDLIHVDDRPANDPGLGVFLTYTWRRGSSDYYPRTSPVTYAASSALQREQRRKLHQEEVAAVAKYRSQLEHEEMIYDQAVKLARRMGRRYHLGPIHNREDE